MHQSTMVLSPAQQAYSHEFQKEICIAKVRGQLIEAGSAPLYAEEVAVKSCSELHDGGAAKVRALGRERRTIVQRGVRYVLIPISEARKIEQRLEHKNQQKQQLKKRT